jgi:GTP cyclohydrolase I
LYPTITEGDSQAMHDHENMSDVIISLGSNVERERHIPEAIRLLRRNRHIDVHKVSRFFESDSVGGPDDAPPFFNAAVWACTELDPEEVREALRHIEQVLGRERSEDDPNAPRTIDLDLSYYQGVAKDFGAWELPDPQAEAVPHVAIPIADVAPDWQHPVSGDTAYDIVTRLDTTAENVRPVTAITLSSPYESRTPQDWEGEAEVYAPHLESLIREQLLEIGEDPNREGLVRTPLRVAKAMDYLTRGYVTSLDEVVNNAIFDAEGADEMVLVKGVEFYSMCEHHMLPFFGKATVAYLPNDKIIGLSKIARIVDLFARRLQVQERMTNQIADAIEQILNPLGVAVTVEGKHLCMMMRGVQKQDSSMTTSAMRGTFKESARTRAEFLALGKD